MSEVSDRLLIAVARRRRWASLGRWFVRLTLIAAVVYAIWLIVARMGLVPDWASPLAVLVVPAVAAVAALVVHRRCDRLDAARLADERLASCDLFLTHTCDERRQAMGTYGPLVAEAAESAARQASAAAIVPWNAGPGASRVAIVLGVLAIASWWTPAFDPFGAAEDRRQVADRRQALDEQKQTAAKRIDELKRQPLDAKNTKRVDDALAELKKTLGEMKPQKPRDNLDKLAQQQKKLAADWMAKSAEDLRRNDGGSGTQRFGAADQQKMDQWNQKLRAGDASALRQQMDEIAKLAEQLADAKTDAERRELAKEIRQKLDDLADFADRHASSTGLQQAIERAQSAAQSAGDPQIGDEARDMLQQAMEQGGLEADQLAQQLRDLDALSDALRSVQMARALNQGERGLDGQQAQGLNSVDDYREWFEQQMREGNLMPGELAQGEPCPHCQGGGKSGEGGPCPHCKGAGKMAGAGQGADGTGGTGVAGTQGGRGGAFGGPGRGAGGSAPEDPTQQVGFKSEQSRSALQAGRMLLSTKTKELAPAGEAKLHYADAIERVRQGAGEAIVSERVPPGYHDDIRQYFDSLPAGGPAHE